VGQRPDLVEGVQVGARQAVRLALVEVAAQPDVPVGQGEQGFRLGQQVEIEPGFAHMPWIDGESFVGDHDCSSSARSLTTTSAPLRRKSSAWPTRSTPTTKPKLPARPAATPDKASSNTAAASGATSSNCAPRR